MIKIRVQSVAGHGKESEDAVKYAQITPDVFAIAVADGMGGRSSGAQASQTLSIALSAFLSNIMFRELKYQLFRNV